MGTGGRELDAFSLCPLASTPNAAKRNYRLYYIQVASGIGGPWAIGEP